MGRDSSWDFFLDIDCYIFLFSGGCPVRPRCRTVKDAEAERPATGVCWPGHVAWPDFSDPRSEAFWRARRRASPSEARSPPPSRAEGDDVDGDGEDASAGDAETQR